MGHPLGGVRAKIERAKKHIDELDIEARSFLDSDPYLVRVQPDFETGDRTYYVVKCLDTPTILPVICGDILFSIRSALDHLAYALFKVGSSGKAGCGRHIYFPIADDAAKYEAEKLRKVKGMSHAAIQAIDAVKPYRGGNDDLWLLHQLHNRDKHRLLVTPGSAFRGVHLGNLARVSVSHTADGFCPLKEGAKLWSVRVNPSDLPIDTKLPKNLKFSFSIAFGEPEIAKGKPVSETLQGMTDLVAHLVDRFDRAFF